VSDDKPFFRFHPGAYERGAFVESDQFCDVCKRPSVWLYDGIVYTAGEKPSVCARCIANGKLAEHIKSRVSLHDADLDGDVDADLETEVMQRTPGFATFNAFQWPVLRGKPLAYVGHGEEESTWQNRDAAAAIRKLYARERGEKLEGTTPYALVFKELKGGKHVAIVDLD
jgi:uncharacterized protein CbrC (UPF0167 family)